MFDQHGHLTWRRTLGRQSPRNVYPTHSLGPVAQWLGCTGVRATDRLAEVVCWTTPDLARRLYVEDRFGTNHPAASSSRTSWARWPGRLPCLSMFTMPWRGPPSTRYLPPLSRPVDCHGPSTTIEHEEESAW